MRRKLAAIGLVLFLVGIALLFAGVYATKGALHPVNDFTLRSPGEYVSPELNLTQAATVTIEKAPSREGLVTAQNLSIVNATNLGTEGVPATVTTSGTVAYSVSAGSYYVVSFGNSAPTTTVDYLYTNTVALYGLATLAGLALAVAGGVVGLIGAFRKPKPPVGAPPTNP
ncbi:MAG: hypothetical protein ACRECT_07895 [Thermoplasmata archaeon]